MTLAPTRAAVPQAHALRRRIRAARPRRPLLTTLFERALYLGVLGGMTFEAVRDRTGPVEPDGTPVIRLTAAVAALLCLVLLAKALLAFGPLHVSAPARTWLLSTPVDRGRLLARNLAAVIATAAGASAALGLAFSLVSGLAVPLPPWLALWAAIGVIEACACVLLQAGRASIRRTLDVLTCTLVGAAIAIPFLHPADVLAPLEQIDATTYAAALLLTAVPLLLAARRALDSMTRGTLSSGVELATAAQVSALSLDFTFLWSIALERRARAMVRVRPAPIRGNRFTALVRADIARVLRMRGGLFVWAALIPVPYTAHVAGMTVLLPAFHLVVAFLAVDRLAGGLRIVSRAPALRRALGDSDRLLTLAHLVVPAAGATVWCAATAFVPGISVAATALSAVGAVLVTYRTATRPPVDYGGALIDLGLFGPVPLTLITQLLRGPALLAVLALGQVALART
ncbi:DUF6297 family protein [Actinomadura hibisca]|uniref:DUF6297 family protein n=1 Tax=Actinomadura hibisca TaxID=68565 RepID=UPI00082C9EA1|nr:DUF6297 family protein [Actinomadura hibisca]